MSEQGLDLARLLGMVTQTLSQKRDDLNQADTYNHDHGDHVVEVFELLTQVAKEHPSADTGELLSLASQLLEQKNTGTARAYAQNLRTGAEQLRGKSLTQQTLPLLIQALLGSSGQGQPPTAAQPQPTEQPSGGLGDLLGGLLGGGTQQESPPQQSGGDLVSGLLGALMGGGGQQEEQSQGNGLDVNDLLRAGAAFMQASQSGKSTAEAALDALVAATGMGQTPHRAESAKLVMQALMQAAQKLGK